MSPRRRSQREEEYEETKSSGDNYWSEENTFEDCCFYKGVMQLQ